MNSETFKAKFSGMSLTLLAIIILTGSSFANVNFAVQTQTGSFAEIFRAETAALLGKVRLISGDAGISKVKIVLIEPGGTERVAISNPFGFYRFDNLVLDAIYQLIPTAKCCEFNGIVLRVKESETVFDIIGAERKN
jgi:hypothetical protein